MSNKTLKTRGQLEADLREQLRLLESSSDRFDDGDHAEAKPLANRIRVLVHNTRESHALLMQLGRMSEPFLDTASAEIAGSLDDYWGLCAMDYADGPSAHLDSPFHSGRIPFDQWWDQIVIRTAGGAFSRKRIVLHLANRDGGSHIDPYIEQGFEPLRTGAGVQLGIDDGAGKMDFGGGDLISVRQIAHELLKTFRPEYGKNYQGTGWCTMGGFSMTVTDAAGNRRAFAPNVSLNLTKPAAVRMRKPCPCNSGKLFKDCHGMVD